MAKLIEQPALSAGQMADDDVLYGGDMSATVGQRDATFPLGALREYLGAGITVGVQQAAHGLNVGDVVRFDGSDYVPATADTEANAEAVGVVTATETDAFAYQTAGVISTLSGLTPGELYYLQDDGSLGTSAGTVEKPILIATSSTSAVLILAISGAGGGGGAANFTDLSDAPSSYAGHGGKVVAVTSGEDGLEFVSGGGGGGSAVDINAQTGTTYTLVLGDAGKLVTLTNGSPITLTVPTNASVAFDTGTVIALAQLGAGIVTVEGDTGVTINGATPGDEDMAGQWATATLTKLATNTWLLSGGLA